MSEQLADKGGLQILLDFDFQIQQRVHFSKHIKNALNQMQGTHQPKIIEKIIAWQMEHALEKAADRLRSILFLFLRV